MWLNPKLDMSTSFLANPMDAMGLRGPRRGCPGNSWGQLFYIIYINGHSVDADGGFDINFDAFAFDSNSATSFLKSSRS
jgi:hypothetical protein